MKVLRKAKQSCTVLEQKGKLQNSCLMLAKRNYRFYFIFWFYKSFKGQNKSLLFKSWNYILNGNQQSMKLLRLTLYQPRNLHAKADYKIFKTETLSYLYSENNIHKS